MGFFDKLKKSWQDNILWEKMDDEFYDDLTDALILSDVGAKTAADIVWELQNRAYSKRLRTEDTVKDALRDILKSKLEVGDSALVLEGKPAVVLVIGVNGVGKTTSIGKLAKQLKDQGKKVLLCAGDTFRAAAADQLEIWAGRAGVDIIRQHEGADPAAVVFDALQSFKSKNADLLIIDTAGRLHNKKNLMEELRKIYKILEREYPEAYLETLVVLDGTTGQNALSQARQFAEVANVNGIILTKLDGTAKGGIAIAIHSELGIPVKYIGVGESIDDLQKFDADEFVNALFLNEKETE